MQSKKIFVQQFWLSLCFFGNFGPKWDREGTMDTRREEVERRAEIIILTRHDIPLLPQWWASGTMDNVRTISGEQAQWSKFYFACTFRIGLDCVAGCVSAKYRRTAELCTILLSCIILPNIAQLRVRTILHSCCCVQWYTMDHFTPLFTITIVAATICRLGQC